MIKKTIISIFLLLLITLFFVPLILSNYLGSWALDKYVQMHGGTISTNKISLNWLGPQEFQGLKLQLKDGSTITADKISVDASVLSALTNRIPLARLRATNVSATFLNGTLQLQKMNFSAVPEGDNFRLNLDGHTTSDNQHGQFLVDALLNPNDQKILEASGTVDRIPVALLDKFMGARSETSSAWPTAILGSTANLYLQKTADAVIVAVDTSTVKGKFSIAFSPDGIEAHNTVPLTFQVSPQLFQLLKKDLSPVALKKLQSIDEYTFNTVEFSTNRAHDRYTGLIAGDLEGFPVKAKFAGDLNAPGDFVVERGDAFSVELQIPPTIFNQLREALYGAGSGDYLVLEEATKMTIELAKLHMSSKELTLNVVMEPLVAKNSQTGQLIHFPQMNGQLNSTSGSNFTLQMHAGNSDLQVTGKGAGNIQVHATLNHFFYGIFSDLLTGNPQIRERAEATLGNDLSGDITAALASGNGYVNGEVKGDHGSIDLSAAITDGFLTLRTPFVLQTKMSPPLAQNILGALLPFLSSGLESDQMVVLRIEPEQFYAPISGANLTNIQVGQGSLQLGRMLFKNDGAIESMLSILKPAAAGQISVWFTPAYFSIHKGVLALQRLDMLALQAYHLAVWGNVDFTKETVDMKLGLGATALNKAFNMPNPLSHDEMVAFPLRGPFGNASVDKGRALTQITGLIAKLQGTPQGFLIGTFIQAAGKIGEDPIPPPTTSPFPWEGQIRPSGESAPSGEGGVLKKPIKQLIRILGF